MKKNSIFVPSIYIHEKLIRFYSKTVPSKVMKKNSIIVPSIYFHAKPSIFSLIVFREKVECHINKVHIFKRLCDSL